MPVGESDGFQKLIRTGFSFILRPFLQAHDKSDIFGCRQNRDQVKRLKDEADMLHPEVNQFRGFKFRKMVTRYQNFPAGRLV
jgi:hypothetical protein